MVTQRLERMVAQVRRWREGTDTDPLPVAPTLSDADKKRLRRLIDDCIEGKGGELAARRRASAIAATFLTLDETGRRAFFEMLANEYDHDDEAVDRAIDRLVRTKDSDERRDAEHELSQVLRPRRELLLTRFIGLEDGLPFLVNLREELRAHRRHDAGIATVDAELRRLLTAWFDLAMLKLEQIDWDSPAALLEKLIEYEAVHAIESWDDMKGRLGVGRRCYGFFHPLMPGEPLIFVEVALTQGIARELGPLLDHDAPRRSATEADTAIFYSISNCQRGLAGVSLGDFLIKRVVEDLGADLPELRQFATLSPIPGFRAWLLGALDRPGLLDDHEQLLLSPQAPEAATEALRAIVTTETAPPATMLEPLKPLFLRLAAHYLVNERRDQRALDPVAHFHLSNGARVEQLNWLANLTDVGWDRGLGLMVNYRYVLNRIEANHDRYVNEGTIEMTDEVKRLANGGAT